jgi:hypothetical protein
MARPLRAEIDEPDHQVVRVAAALLLLEFGG